MISATMMTMPLLLSGVIEHAARCHGETEVVSRRDDGTLHRQTYADTASRARRLARALIELGAAPGDVIGTLAWNGNRHLELYYGVPGAGMVCHTINPRLFAEQIAFIIKDAGDRFLFVDPGFLGLLEGILPDLPAIEAVVVMDDRAPAAELAGVRLLAYEEVLATQADDAFDWPSFDENAAAGICYTSGTTGNPKGVVYSHRSTILHALSAVQPDVFALSAQDTVMPVVPMFHVNAWGMPHAAPMVGAKLVLPGGRLDGASLIELIRGEQVTATAGVPTVWQGLLGHVEAKGGGLAPLDRVVIGGAACPPSMMSRFAALGTRAIHAWGMTETSPLCVASVLTARHRDLEEDEALRLRLKQGRPAFGADLRIVDHGGRALPWDGVTRGMLEVRGPWICAGYLNNPDRTAFSEDGWFATGDVATITADGFMDIVDRTKDVIKSGGEWISSIALENIAIGHPAVREVAAIARPDARWGERPRLVVALREGAALTPTEMAAWFEGKVAKWWIPDDLVIVETLPHTATGKLQKRELRQLYGAERLESAQAL
ncbi:long-chain fatty acid--CoA ligase [Rhodospirillum rubrum]|uniref:long-chain fatty acid--CoA ligase n=1 Tax=Rhodospirillum rubrum TaxID=1085 RepID=UPI001A92F1E3|nr:long-chain fatty acid--CoA ligase [Rhodospirillum rubrum]MBK1662994.1 long-chain fatty acid--CoA ligase [Rhodospirillum rubrum]MBK1676007.1 long-chain fatty acid--CoA ligase [Rhodospirillum rubrum]